MLNEIKSKYVLNIIFKHIKNRRKLNVIKYNKFLLDKLYITKEDFQIYEPFKRI